MTETRANQTWADLARWLDAEGIAFERIDWDRSPRASAPFLVLTQTPVAIVLNRGNEVGGRERKRLFRLRRRSGIPCAIATGPADALLETAQALVRQATGQAEGFDCPDGVTVEVSR